MKKSDVVLQLLHAHDLSWPKHNTASAYAPTNIALCKYWGKRCTELNLPLTDSLSVTLPDKGAHVTLTLNETQDDVWLNKKNLDAASPFVTRLVAFLNLFRRKKNWFLTIEIDMSIPVAAGLASSACGFASIVLALNELFQWQVSKKELSILCRLGSGSAARSLWNGFVLWHSGHEKNGMDSVAEPFAYDWPGLKIGILPLSKSQKSISSREAMQRTVDTSVLYQSWPEQVARDLILLKQAIVAQDFHLLGATAESNALAMHATMQSSWPPICYHLPETLAAMQTIWSLRNEGCPLYFTQDAGPNLKLILEEKDEQVVKNHFPELMIESVDRG